MEDLRKFYGFIAVEFIERNLHLTYEQAIEALGFNEEEAAIAGQYFDGLDLIMPDHGYFQ